MNKVDPSGRQFDLASVSVSLAINTSIEQYQVAFARAGSKAIVRSARIANHLISPGIKMQYLGLESMEKGAPGGEEMFSLGMELEQTGYRLLQSVIAGIYVETFNSAKAEFVVGPLKIELGMVSGSISLFGKKAEYGKEYADYADTLDKILESCDQQIKAIGGPNIDTDMEEGAKKMDEYLNKALDKISKGPSEWKSGGK